MPKEAVIIIREKSSYSDAQVLLEHKPRAEILTCRKNEGRDLSVSGREDFGVYREGLPAFISKFRAEHLADDLDKATTATPARLLLEQCLCFRVRGFSL